MTLVASKIDYNSVALGRRLIAVFQPQHWVHDYAISSEDAVLVDVTEPYLRLAPYERAQIRDSDFSSDNLVHAVGLPNDHKGPFDVAVEAQIAVFHEPEGVGS